jgi:hypothetical protein
MHRRSLNEILIAEQRDRISPVAMAAVAADPQNGDLANIHRFVGASLLFQPQKSVTRAEAAVARVTGGRWEGGIREGSPAGRGAVE